MASLARHRYEKASVIHGHHVYKAVWTPVIGEELAVKPEVDNEHDDHAIVVMKLGDVVGHVPRSISDLAFRTQAFKDHARARNYHAHRKHPGFALVTHLCIILHTALL